MIRINLLPAEIRKKREKKRLLVYISAGGVIVIGAFLGISILKFIRYQGLVQQLKTVESELKKLEPILKEIEQRQQEKQLLLKKYQIMKDLMQNCLLYPQFLEEMVNIIPGTVWLSNLTTKSAGNILEVNLDASALDNYAIADFLIALEKKGYFSNIELGTIQKGGTKGSAFSFRVSFRYQK